MPEFERGYSARGEIKSWIEDDRGIVGLFGAVDSQMTVQISLAAGEHIADRGIGRVVFDFEYTDFLDSGLLGVLNTTHKLTVRAGLKEMSLRNITDPNIRRLLEATGLDKTLVIEEEDEVEGAASQKMRFSMYRPSDTSL